LLNVSPDNTQAQVFLANMQLFQGNLAQAERLLQRVIATSPDNLQARKLLAQVQLRQSQPAGAVEALAPMLDGDSQDDDVYTLLAQASLQQGDMGGAIIQLQKAVELDPENMDAKLNLASAYLNMGSTDLALELLDQVPEGAGSANQRERLMMAALVADGRQDAADAIATNLLAGSDSDPASTAIVVDHYIRTKRVEQAKQILEQFIGNNPDQLDPKNALARVELSSGNLDAARDLFESVVASDASNLIALLGLSAIAEQAGEMQRMIELLQTAAETNREAAAPRALLARYYLAQGEVVEAENYANELVLIGSQNARINSVVANVLIAAGRLEEALTYAEKAALVASGSAEAQLGLARAQLALNQTTDAREALKRALEISPGLPRAMTLLTLLELREGNTEEANTLVAQLRSQYPDDLAGMVLEGEVLQAQEQYALAAEAFRRAADNGAGRSAMLREYQARVDGQLPQPEATLARWLSEQPDDAVARSFLAQHYQRQQEADRAIQEYQKVLDQDPDNAVVLNNLAWEYQQIGDLDRAAELAEKAFALQGSSGSIADTLGWIYYEQGQFDKSVEMLSTASQLSPNNGEIQYHYAAALSATGDSEAARGLLQQLKDKNVQFPSRQLADELLESL
jgi:putative PEP-CTERM system TPR-repeat lipoprotein